MGGRQAELGAFFHPDFFQSAGKRAASIAMPGGQNFAALTSARKMVQTFMAQVDNQAAAGNPGAGPLSLLS